MRVTNAMMLGQAMYDLGGLREKYMKAQNAVNGRVLERASEDPQKAVEAMDLSGAKLRLERAQESGEDAKEWLSTSENSLNSIIDRLQAARELAVQAGGPSGLGDDSREALARNVEGIRDSVIRELNTQSRDRYIFAGWKTDVKPFSTDAAGNAVYSGGSGQEIVRDIAPGLSVNVNVPGDELLASGDFIKTLNDMAADIRAGRKDDVSGTRLGEIDKEMGNLIVLRSDMGQRQEQVSHYDDLAQQSMLEIEGRLSKLTGADLETAFLNMTQAQSAYQAALSSFAKSLPTSLLDYLK